MTTPTQEQHDRHCLDWFAYRYRQFIVRQVVREMSGTWARAFDRRNWMEWLPMVARL